MCKKGRGQSKQHYLRFLYSQKAWSYLLRLRDSYLIRAYNYELIKSFLLWSLHI